MHLPKPWFAAERRADWKACRIPEGTPFQTKHDLAAQMVERVRAEPHLLTCWLVCDEWYGDSPLFLDRVATTGLWYVGEVSRHTSVWPLVQPDGKLVRARPRAYLPPRAGPHGRHRSRLRLHPSSPAFQSAEQLIRVWPARAWKRFRVLEGHKGPIVAEFLAIRVLAVRDGLPGPEVWLLIRHKIRGAEDVPEWKFYLSNAPPQTSLTELVRVTGMRWPTLRCFADCKGELGLDHYELRTWRGWHHHQTLVLLAHHFLVRCLLRLEPREEGLLEAVPRPMRIAVLQLPVREQIPLSVAQIRLLLQVALPLPVLDIPAALALITYQQQHKLAAYRSHRKRILKRLMALHW